MMEPIPAAFILGPPLLAAGLVGFGFVWGRLTAPYRRRANSLEEALNNVRNWILYPGGTSYQDVCLVEIERITREALYGKTGEAKG